MTPKEDFYERYRERIIIGLYEEIDVLGNNGNKKRVMARVDTGATMSSIDSELVKELGLGPVIRTKIVKQAQGKTVRDVIEVRFLLAGHEHSEKFTIADRSHLKYQVLLGQNALANGYLIDPHKHEMKD